MTERFSNPVPQFTDDAGDPVVSGTLDFFETGGSTRKNTFADVNQNILNNNPVLLSGSGRVPNIFYPGTARVVLKNSSGTQIFDRDVVGVLGTGAAFEDWNSVVEYEQEAYVVGSDGEIYRSLQNNNLGNDPTTSTTFWERVEFISEWNENVSYNLNDIAKGSDGFIYRSVVGSNLNNDPQSGGNPSFWGTPLFGGFDQTLDTTSEPTFKDLILSDFDATYTVSDALLEIVSVKKFGAVGDGSTDDSVSIQAAIDDADTKGGGIIFFPPGTYRAEAIEAKNNITVKAAFGSVTIKSLDSTDNVIFFNPDSATTTTVDFFALEGLILDGNKASAAGVVATSVVALDGCTFFRARDCTFQNGLGYGLAFQGHLGGSQPGDQTEIYLENCYFLNNGDGVGGPVFDGLDIKDSDTVTIIGCSADGNDDKGIDVRGENVSVSGCSANNNGTDGFGVSGNAASQNLPSTVTLSGLIAINNTIAGLAVSDGSLTPLGLIKCTLNGFIGVGNNFGIDLPAETDNVEFIGNSINISSSVSHGIRLNNSSLRNVMLSKVRCKDNGGSGIFTKTLGSLTLTGASLLDNTLFGYEESTGAGSNKLSNVECHTNTSGPMRFETDKAYLSGIADFNIESSSDGDIIASASTIEIPHGSDVVYITGTTNINTITANLRSQRVTLLFSDILTVFHGTGNIRLAAGGNKITANKHTLTLIGDGTDWFEIGYSANT